MGIPTKELDNFSYPRLIFCQTSSKVVLKTEFYTYESQELLSHDDINANTMCVGYIILAAATEAVIDKSWCLPENKLTCNSFIKDKYMSNIINAPYRLYTCTHCNAGMTYTNNISELPG